MWLKVTQHRVMSAHLKEMDWFAQMHNNDVVCLQGAERARGMKRAEQK